MGQFLPFHSRLFDLVIVDEASQVNIAEIIPAFYRGARVCVVGDHKQLGLNAAGLFTLNKTFEQLVWNLHFADGQISFDAAKDRSLLVSKSSILEFTQEALQLRPVTLTEHFRSHPKLARFTSDNFYADDGRGLRIMRELYGNVRRPCFRAVRVGGQRLQEEKIAPGEVNETIRLLTSLMVNKSYMHDQDLKPHGYSDQTPPTIGVISFLTQQRNKLRAEIESFAPELIEKHSLFVGTPEDFQGNERNIMILTFGLDPSLRYAKGFYEEPRRFNVATSRAIDFTYAIFGGLPSSADLICRYLRHFDPSVRIDESAPAPPSDTIVPAVEQIYWDYDRSRCESEFEQRVVEFLEAFCRIHQVNLFNQVESCGQKRLDFVLYHERTDVCVAVEVDGRDHYATDGRSYSEAHLDRVDILQRAGWKILHIPYYAWYQNGWLADQSSPEFKQTLNRLTEDLRRLLGIVNRT
ncbi:MAG TPA: AAA domain-containing protein [Phycisphaerae bacterium]|nr:AAA domain-containing protein [Phycisphaerae bacterium]